MTEFGEDSAAKRIAQISQFAKRNDIPYHASPPRRDEVGLYAHLSAPDTTTLLSGMRGLGVKQGDGLARASPASVSVASPVDSRRVGRFFRRPWVLRGSFAREGCVRWWWT